MSVEQAKQRASDLNKLNRNLSTEQKRDYEAQIAAAGRVALVKPLPSVCRDVTAIGHFGTGDIEVSIKNSDDLAVAEKLIKESFSKAGG